MPPLNDNVAVGHAPQIKPNQQMQPKLIELPADAQQTADTATRDTQRELYREKLAQHLKDPAFRAIEGFPRGSDEAILALSDPPFYTACPNPFLADWLAQNGTTYDAATDDYSCEPFAADVSEGKNDPIYNAHSYHTKVPHKAIMRYILHYTKPGDVVYDGFCGTGMTGVAAQLCGDKAQVQSLGYTIKGRDILDEDGHKISELGARRAIVSDLSPVASFIAHNYNTALDNESYKRACEEFFADIERELGWMYETQHTNGATARISYTVWSECFSCPQCSGEIVFLREALDKSSGQVRAEFPCPHCKTLVTKRKMSRLFETFNDALNGTISKRVKREPVFIAYKYNGEKHQKTPDEADLARIRKIEATPLHDFFPTLEVPFMHITHIKDKMSNFGISHFSHFFLPRAQHALAVMWRLANQYPDIRTRHALIYTIEQCIWGMTIMNRYSPTHFSQSNRYMSGVFYVPSQCSETTPWYVLEGKIKRLIKVFDSLPKSNSVRVSLNSCSAAPVTDDSIDYIFTDPPFGENLQYSELNWFNEEFYRVLPDTSPEAVVNKAQKKGTIDYLALMTRCFTEYFRVLKPGRWMTVEFHNSSNAIWNAIQEGLEVAGFVIADVRVLDKGGDTYKQSRQGTVKSDLVISCYKPRTAWEQRFADHAGEAAGVVDFLRGHLEMLPVAPLNGRGQLERVAERTRFLLFDRMVGYHLQRGARIPLSAAEFYGLLEAEFVSRDDLYFLPTQAARYDALRVKNDVEPLSLWVKDERSAVQWVRAQLNEAPQTLGELTPAFMQELAALEAYEERFELRDLLKENFIEEGGVWRVPNPDRERDIELLRVKGLLATFEGYVDGKGKLSHFRKEAIIAGFSHAWKTKQYAVIVKVAERIPEKVLREIHEFTQFYDIAKNRAPETPAQLGFEWD